MGLDSVIDAVFFKVFDAYGYFADKRDDRRRRAREKAEEERETAYEEAFTVIMDQLEPLIDTSMTVKMRTRDGQWDEETSRYDFRWQDITVPIDFSHYPYPSLLRHYADETFEPRGVNAPRNILGRHYLPDQASRHVHARLIATHYSIDASPKGIINEALGNWLRTGSGIGSEERLGTLAEGILAAIGMKNHSFGRDALVDAYAQGGFTGVFGALDTLAQDLSSFSSVLSHKAVKAAILGYVKEASHFITITEHAGETYPLNPPHLTFAELNERDDIIKALAAQFGGTIDHTEKYSSDPIWQKKFLDLPSGSTLYLDTLDKEGIDALPPGADDFGDYAARLSVHLSLHSLITFGTPAFAPRFTASTVDTGIERFIDKLAARAFKETRHHLSASRHFYRSPSVTYIEVYPPVSNLRVPTLADTLEVAQQAAAFGMLFDERITLLLAKPYQRLIEKGDAVLEAIEKAR